MTTKQPLSADDIQLSQHIEDLLVSKNLRGMKGLQPLLKPGYYARAAQLLLNLDGPVIIGTGFPVNSTFETDGPVGAIALYQGLETIGATPILACGDPLFSAIKNDYRVLQMPIGDHHQARQQTLHNIACIKPAAVISIERPGKTASGQYFNMRGEDISERCACFDYYLTDSDCPSIGIGDGGNEIGMGNIHQRLSHLNIVPSITPCTELIIADVSNWAAYGLLALLQKWGGQPLLEKTVPAKIIRYLSHKGGVDGVTRLPTLTEDGLDYVEGERLLVTLRDLIK